MQMTVEEENVLAIFHSPKREILIHRLDDAMRLPYADDEADLKHAIEGAAHKIRRMTDAEYATFKPVAVTE